MDSENGGSVATTDEQQVSAGLPDLQGAGGAEGVDAPKPTAAGGDDEQVAGTGITIDGRQYDVADLNLGEIEVLEDVTGVGFAKVDYDRVANLRVMLWLLRKRDDPSYTLEDSKLITLRDLTGAKPAVQNAVGALEAAQDGAEAAQERREQLEQLEETAAEVGAGPTSPASEPPTS